MARASTKADNIGRKRDDEYSADWEAQKLSNEKLMRAFMCVCARMECFVFGIESHRIER